jgi:hypothetical protein
VHAAVEACRHILDVLVQRLELSLQVSRMGDQILLASA